MTRGYCKVRNCDKFGAKDYKSVYHLPRFRIKEPLTPSQELRLKRRKAWLKALGYREEGSSGEVDNLVVCPKHFVSGKPAPIRDVNNVDWVPNLHLGLDGSSNSNKSGVVDLTEDSEQEEEFDSNKVHKKRKVPTDTADVNVVSPKLLTTCAVHSVGRKLPHLTPSPLLIKILKEEKDTDNKGSLEPNLSINIKDCEEKHTSDFEGIDGLNSSEIIRKLKDENQRLLSQNLSLKAKLLETQSLFKSLENDHRISMSKFSDLRYLVDMFTVNEKTFVSDEEVVHHFTGLPTYDVLKAMFTHIERFMDDSQYPLTKFQQYILTLMCIRLNLGFDLLSYVFRSPVNLVTKIFARVLQVMHARYKALVSWPTRTNLFQSVPLLFRENFGPQIVSIVDTLELSVIIDSIEVRFDGSSENGSSTVVSDYSHPTSVKFVIGLTPQGAVTFVSKSFTGTFSEKELIEDSGLLLNLVPEDVVIGSKGSSVYQVFENKPDSSAKRKRSASADGNSLSLRPYELRSGQDIASLRLHVQRVTDTFKKIFKYWTSGIPVEFFNVDIDGPSAIEKMIHTCCALNNASLTVVA